MSTASGDALRITVDDNVATIRAGETFAFGRNDGPGQIGAEDPTVSRVHGLIANHADRWEITSLGSYVGILIHDVDSAATIEVPAGSGPLTVPFASVILVVPARRRYAITVEAPHGPTAPPDRPPSAGVGGDATEQVIPESACFDQTGRPLRWFQVLIALCEPRLLVGRGPVTIPADAEIRQRLGMGPSAFDRAFARARTELGFEPYTHLVRVAMVNTALHQAIVRPEHLTLLDDGPLPDSPPG